MQRYEKDKTLKCHQHQTRKLKDVCNRHSLMIEADSNGTFTEDSEENDESHFSTPGEKVRIELCPKHDIESINHSTPKVNVIRKELINSIRKLPAEINKTNAFLNKNIHRNQEMEKPVNNNESVRVNGNQKVTPQITKPLTSKKHDHSVPPGTKYSETDNLKDAKTRIASYVQSFISRPLGESSDKPGKSKLRSCPSDVRSKNTKKYNLPRIHVKQPIPVRDDSKYNLRAKYIQWLLAEKKFFNTLDTVQATESNTTATQSKHKGNETTSFDDKRNKNENKKKSKRQLKQKKEKNQSQIIPFNNIVSTTTKSLSNTKESAKNSDAIFDEIMVKKNFSVERLRHIRWLASVENILRIKSREFIKRTISMNELYSYIPTHDDDNNIENLLQPNHDEAGLNEMIGREENKNHGNLENRNESNGIFQAKLYNATVENDFSRVFHQSLEHITDNEMSSDVLERSESVESVSIAIKKRSNEFDSSASGSLNIEIFHNTDSCTGTDAPSKSIKNQSISYNNESDLSKNAFNYNDYSYERNTNKPNFCPVFQTPANFVVNNHGREKFYLNDSDYRKNPALETPKFSDSINKIRNIKQNKLRIIGRGNDYNNDSLETKHRDTLSNKNFNSSYIKVNGQKATIKRPTRFKLTNANTSDKVNQLRSPVRSNLYISNKGCSNQSEQYDIKLVYEDSAGNLDQCCIEDIGERTNKLVQCNIYSSSSAFSNVNLEMNRKRKYCTEDEAETEYNNINEHLKERIMSAEISENSFSIKNEEKSNELLIVMTDLRQKVDFIHEQISLMNINCNKCGNIEAMLVKLKTDVASGLKHVQTKLKEIENESKNMGNLKQKNETDASLAQSPVTQTQLIKSFIAVKPLESQNEEEQSKSECYEINESDHKIFREILGNLSEQLKNFSLKEGKTEENILLKEVGSMTEETQPTSKCCNCFCTSDKKAESLSEKGIQCDLGSSPIEAISKTKRLMAIPFTSKSNDSMLESVIGSDCPSNTAKSTKESKKIPNFDIIKNKWVVRNENTPKKKINRGRTGNNINPCHIL